MLYVALYATKLYVKLVCNYLLVLDMHALNILFQNLLSFNQCTVRLI